MPAGRPEASASGGNAPQRTNFRPPWVKEAPPAIPMPTAPWTLANRNKEIAQAQQAKQAEADAAKQSQPARKTSSVKITPVVPQENGTVKDPHTFQVPKLKETPKTEAKLQSREIKVPVTVTQKPKETPIQVHIETTRRNSQAEKETPIVKDLKKSLQEVKKDRKVEPKQEPEFKRPELRKVETKEEPKFEPKEKFSIPELRKVETVKPEIKKEEFKIPELKKVEKQNTINKEDKEVEIDKAIPSQRNAMVRQESLKKISGQMGPPAPPMPPPPPPAPPKIDTNLSEYQKEKLDQLRSRPRRRPDWGALMKDIDSGKTKSSLKKVQCNDRSQPLLPSSRQKGQFIYDSEKPNLHNQLLRQIQSGKMLKHVKCNDRSKPILEGLRKFRRQMTIEEQIIKSQSMANMTEPEVEEEIDEMDDIDKVRDDLQSTKQMLALELRNKEAQIRENKRLQAKIALLEAEIEEERNRLKQESNIQNSTPDEKAIQVLKEEITSSKKNAEEVERKYHEATDKIEVIQFNLDEQKRQNQLLEKKIQQIMQDGGVKRSQSLRRESTQPVKQKSMEKEESEEEIESESESESEGEDNEAKAQKRMERELRLLGNKLRSYKNKEEAARRERKSLRDQMKKNQQAIKSEKKKYRELQHEVNKMAALMRDDDEEAEEEEEEEKEKEEGEEEQTEESESEESESETSEEEDSSDEDENMPLEQKKEILQSKAKRHENCLNALKKGNYMLKANVDRLLDDLNKTKEEVITLQEDLDSVLADLG